MNMNTGYKNLFNFLLNSLKKVNLTYLVLGLIILCGIILRLKVYFYNQSFWGDECSLGRNIIERNYLELFKSLSCWQVAPPFFMVICKFIINISHQINNLEARDMMLRLFPCFCSIASLPLFAYLISKMFDNKYILWIGTALMAFNPVAINYAQEFKQYSCEMMFAIILTIVFYSIDIKKISYKKLGLCSLLFTVSLWFSSSSLFILAAGFIVLFIDMIKNKYCDKTKLAILFIPLIANLCVWVFLYYKPVNKALYGIMHEYWSITRPSFITINNFTNMFVEKMQNLIAFPYPKYLFAFLFINLIILFSSTKGYRNKCYTLIPILLCITASFLQHYPFEQRLILFLLPFFIILYCQITTLLKNQKITTIILIIILCFIGLNECTHSSKKYILHREYFREIATILLKNNPQCKNIFSSSHEVINYYLNLEIDKNGRTSMFWDNLWGDFNSSTIPATLRHLPLDSYWIECPLNSSSNYNEELKKYIYNDPHLKVIQIWTAPYNENVYLIHFKKIKDYE